MLGSVDTAVAAATATHFVPEVSKATLDRPRLRKSLPSAGDGTRLVTVVGPAGSGKTTTLAQWSRAGGHGADALVWVTLHDGDGDRATFWHRILTALQDARIAPEGSFLDRLDPAMLHGSSLRGSLVRAFSALCTPMMLVIDDFHTVIDRHIEEDIRTVLEGSGLISMVIASRTQSSLSDVRTAARLDVQVLDAASFAFTLEETRELMRRHGNSDSEQAAAIFDASDGWPLATRALLVEAERSGDGKIVAVGQQGNFITQYVDWVLEQATALESELLFATSICHEFTASLAMELCGAGADAVAQALTRLEATGVTTARPVMGGVRYAHHPALQAALRHRAQEVLEPEKMRAVRLHYAGWIEGERPDVAFTLLCSVNALDLAQAVLTRNFATLTSIYSEPCRRAMAQTPLQLMSSFPALLSARLLIDHADPAVPLSWLEQCFTLIKDGVRHKWGERAEPTFPELTLLAGLHHMMGDGETAARYAASTAAHLADPEAPQLRPVRTSVPMAHAVVAFTSLLNGDYTTADAHYELCRRDAEGIGQAFEQARGLNGRTLVTAISGDITAASAHASRAELSVRGHDWQDHFGATNLNIAKAWIAVEGFDTATVREELKTLAPVEDVWELWPFMAMAEARVELLTKGARSAGLSLKEAIAAKKRRPRPVLEQRLALVKLQADLAILGGRLLEAEELMERAPHDHWGLRIAKARLLLAQGDPAAAATVCTTATAEFRNSAHRDFRTDADAQLVQATAAWQLGQSERSITIACVLAENLLRLGLRTPLLGVPLAGLTELFTAVDERTNTGALSLLEGLPNVHDASAAGVVGLSTAERAVLTAIHRVGTVEAAADELFLSANTVKSHLRRIYRKLGVSTRRDALALAAEAGFLTDQ